MNARRRSGLALSVVVLSAGVLGLAESSRAQVPTFTGSGLVDFGAVPFGEVNFGMVPFGQVDFGMVPFGQVNFPLVNFPQVGFPMVSPLGYGQGGGYYSGYGYVPSVYGGSADAYRMAKYAMNASRYHTAANGAATAGIAEALVQSNGGDFRWRNGSSGSGGMSPHFNVRTGRSSTALRERASRGARLVDMTSRGGDVLWPIAAPQQGDLAAERQAANDAIKDVMGEYRIRGKVPVAKVTAAIQALAEYTNSATDYLRKEQPEQLGAFANFATDLASGLRNLEPTPAGSQAP